MNMEKLFQKGVVVDLSSWVDYSEGGVVSKQIVKSAAGNITLFSFDKGEGLSILLLLMPWSRYWKVRWK